MDLRRGVEVGIAGAVGLAAVLCVGAVGAVGAQGATAAPPTSADVTLSVAVTLAGGSTVDASGSGQVDFSTDQLAVTVQVPGTLAPILTLLPSSIAGFAAGAAGDTQLQAVVSGGTAFAMVPGLDLGGKDWVGVSLPESKISDAFATAGKALANVQVLLSAVTGHGGKVTSLGTRTVDGVSAQGYAADVATTKILGLVPGLRSVPGSAAPSAIGPTVRLEAWANAESQVVQLSAEGSRTAATSGVASFDAVLDFSGYGSAVTVTPPASTAATVVSGSTLKALIGGARSSKG